MSISKQSLLTVLAASLISAPALAAAAPEQSQDMKDGNQALSAGQYMMALQDFDRVIKTDAHNVNAYKLRATAHTMLGQDEAATADYTQAIAINGNDADLYAGRAHNYIGLDQYDKAIADCTKALEINDKSVTAHYNRAIAYAKKGDGVKAVIDYDAAINLDPASKLFKVFPLIAFADFNKAVEADPKDALALGYRGLAYLLQNKDADAQKDFDQCFKLDGSLKAKFDPMIQEIKQGRSAS
jgi:Tfp pilus assembly protein PilF